MEPERELHLFARLSGDPEFRLWLEQSERSEVNILIEQTDPVRIYQAQARVKFIQTLGKKMQLARERFRG